MTRQRQVILKTLKEMGSHPTADAVYVGVREQLPRMSLATVYRNLELMSKEGLIAEVNVYDKKKRFDGNLQPHHHVQCASCGKISDLFSEVLGKIIAEEAAKKTDYIVSDASACLAGTCPQCQTD